MSFESCGRRINRECAGCLQDGELGALTEFEALFKGAKFHKGLEMVFTNTQTGALALKIGGDEVRTTNRCCSHTP